MKQLASSPVKVTPPQTPALLEREGLYRRLDDAASIVWIQAPPGSGKSWLLAGYLRSREPAALWYRLDARDADPATFFHHLRLCLSLTAPEAEDRLQPSGPEAASAVEAFSTEFFESLYAGLPGSFWVVLDDFQELPSDALTLNALRKALELVPEGGRVACLTREAPPPSLARFRVGGWLTEVERSALDFSREETAELAAMRLGRDPDPEWMERIRQQTHGWAAGTVLMLEDQPEPPVLDSLPCPSSQAAFDYLAAEVFNDQEPCLRSFLMAVAVPPTLTPALAQELSGRAEAGDWLAALASSGHFTTRYPHGAEPYYQFHPLFRSFLLERLREEASPEEREDLKLRAADRLLRNGSFEDALPLLQATGSWARLADELRRRAGQLIDQGRQEPLADWIETIPPAHRETDPWLAFWLGMSRLPADPGAARSGLEQAFAGFREREEAAGLYLAWAAIVGSFFLEWRDFHPLDAWLATLDELRERFPVLPSPEVEARVTCSVLSALAFRRPGHPARAEWEERAERLALDPGRDLEERLSVGSQLVLLTCFQGEPRKSDSLAEALYPLAGEPGVRPLTRTTWHAVLTAPYTFLGRFDRLREETEATRREMRRHGIPFWEMLVGAQETHADLATGQFEAAREGIRRLDGLLDPARTYDVAKLHLMRSRLALESGDTESAFRQAFLGLERAHQCGCPFPVAYLHLQLAWVETARGDREGLRSRMEDLEYLEDGPSLVLRLDYLLLRAYLALTEDPDRLPGLLREAFALGRQQNGLPPFVAYRPFLARLCAEALEAGIETDYVRDLIRRFRLEAVPSLAEYEAWPRPLRIYVLGPLRILRDGEPVRFTGKAQKRPLELLTALIALGGTEVSQQALAEALWPDADGDAGQQAFATTLHRLRKLIGNDALRLQGGRLSLDPARAWVDAWALERKLERLEAVNGSPDPAALAARMQELVELYRGPFLAGADAPWALSRRERLRSRLLRGLEATAERLFRAGEGDEAVTAYHKALELEPLAESAYRGLMNLFLHLGRPAEGLAVYRQCRDQLGRRLDIAPSAETEALRRELKGT